MPDPNENCEGRECLEGFERVGEDCLAVCGRNFKQEMKILNARDLCVNAIGLQQW